MKFIIFVFSAFYKILICHSRLLITEKTTSEVPSTDMSPRVTRAVSQEEAGDQFSKENEFTASGEMMFVRGDKFTQSKVPRHTMKIGRNKRDSSESRNGKTTEGTKNSELTSSRPLLVKKPIPKLSDIDYEEDFQGHLVKSQHKFPDSGENEDEDFNIDDYDFDVNHDEFAGRGKPLEPRVKNKQLLEQHISDNVDTTKNTVSERTKVQQPTKVVSKRHHIAEKSKKVADKVKDDYNDDDYSAPVKISEHKKRNSESDESGASEEYDHKTYRRRRSTYNKERKLLIHKPSKTVLDYSSMWRNFELPKDYLTLF